MKMSARLQKSVLVLSSVLVTLGGLSTASAASLEDVQTKIAPLIPAGRSIREMSGLTTYGGGATCMSSISMKPDELEFFATWGDTGMGLRLNSDDDVEMVQSGNQLKLTVLREGLPASVTLTLRGSEITSMLLEETYKSLFFKRHATLLCDQQVTFIPRN